MPCDPTLLRQVQFFALFDDDELAVLASRVDVRTFAPRQRIYKIGDAAGTAYVLLSGRVRVTTIITSSRSSSESRMPPST